MSPHWFWLHFLEVFFPHFWTARFSPMIVENVHSYRRIPLRPRDKWNALITTRKKFRVITQTSYTVTLTADWKSYVTYYPGLLLQVLLSMNKTSIWVFCLYMWCECKACDITALIHWSNMETTNKFAETIFWQGSHAIYLTFISCQVRLFRHW